LWVLSQFHTPNEDARETVRPQDAPEPEGPSSQAQPTRGPLAIHSPVDTNQSHDGGRDETPFWEKAAVIIAFGLLIVNWYQGRQTKKAADAAKSAAEIAGATLKASQYQFRTEERPYIFASPYPGGSIVSITPAELGRAVLKTPNEMQPIIERPLSDGRVEIEIVVKITNSGKSPAINVVSTKSQMGIASRTELNQRVAAFVPQYQYDSPGSILASGVQDTVPTGEWVKLSPEELKKVRSKDLVVYVVGGIQYQDVFVPPVQIPYETKYCFIYNLTGISFGECGGSIK